MKYSIFPMLEQHWPEVRQIYEDGLATRNATFEIELPDWGKWDRAHRKDCRLVAEEREFSTPHVLGWAALSPVSVRHVYRGVAEVSVYVAAAARGRGLGRALLQKLVEESEASGIWTLQAGIFPENTPSIFLHKSCGFREVGVRQKNRDARRNLARCFTTRTQKHKSRNLGPDLCSRLRTRDYLGPEAAASAFN